MQTAIQAPLHLLTSFLITAKKETYASGGTKSKRRHHRLYRHSEGDWTYSDRYVGSVYDTGIEIVSLCNYPVWAMTYRGGMIAGHEDLNRETIHFLRKALLQPDPSIPVRGPDLLTEGIWRYENNAEGTILDFVGLETIFHRGKAVYRRRYMGGLIKDKRYLFKVEEDDDHSFR